jgi:transposase-like protein
MGKLLVEGDRMEQLAQPKDFCPNPACPDYGKLQYDQTQPNLKQLGKTKRGVQRYPCKTCGKTFTETKGTLCYRKHAPMEQILELLADPGPAQPGLGGNRISTLTRVNGIKEDTILRWLREAKQHSQELDEVLMKDFHLKRAQIDGLWSFVQNKGEKKATPKPRSAVPSGFRS